MFVELVMIEKPIQVLREWGVFCAPFLFCTLIVLKVSRWSLDRSISRAKWHLRSSVLVLLFLTEIGFHILIGFYFPFSFNF